MSTVETICWNGTDIRSTIVEGFRFIEGRDHIVGIIYTSPSTMKKIVLALADDVIFDYIPEGLGTLWTAYLKFRPLPTTSEIRMVSQDGGLVLKILRQ